MYIDGLMNFQGSQNQEGDGKHYCSHWLVTRRVLLGKLNCQGSDNVNVLNSYLTRYECNDSLLTMKSSLLLMTLFFPHIDS